MKPLLAAVAVVLVGIGGWFYWQENAKQAEPEAIVVESQEPAETGSAESNNEEMADPETAPEPLESLPSEPEFPVAEQLDDSDSVVADLVTQVSPTLAQWLVPQEQVRKWVLAVDLMAEGEYPTRHAPWSYPMPIFKVKEVSSTADQERYMASAKNSQRLNGLVDAMQAIPPRMLGKIYRAWLPLFEQAYGELGKQGTFAERVDLAVENLMAVDPVPQDALLKQPHVLYEYVDANLEKRSALEKAVWRSGEDNRQKLQAYLKELKFYL